MVKVYCHRGEYGHGVKGYPLIKDAAKKFVSSYNHSHIDGKRQVFNLPYISRQDFLTSSFSEHGYGAHDISDFANIDKLIDELGDIELGEKGKPYFSRLPLEFSISHSEELWVCALDFEPVGIDIQFIKDCSYEKIAKRHFSIEEQTYIERFGIRGFFEIWAMREAFGKYTGKGFFDNMPSFVNDKIELVYNIGVNTEIVRVKTFKVQEEYVGAICYSTEEEPEFFSLQTSDKLDL